MGGSFEGRVALVTGGGSGIGRATCLAFAREGARVVIADISAEGGEETAHLVTEAGGDAIFLTADVASDEEVRALVARAVATYGRLDFAVNSAAILGARVLLHDLPDDEWDRVVGVNLTGVFRCMKHELRQMVRQGSGAIVNLSSVAGLRGTTISPSYGATKHGVIGLTKTAALTYAEFGIRVNAVCPGYIRTPMLEESLEAAPDRAQMEARHAAQLLGVGTAEQVAAAVVWLCSDAASLVTGIAMPVDGGGLA